MTNRVVEESQEALHELTDIADQLAIHTARMRVELAKLREALSKREEPSGSD